MAQRESDRRNLEPFFSSFLQRLPPNTPRTAQPFLFPNKPPSDTSSFRALSTISEPYVPYKMTKNHPGIFKLVGLPKNFDALISDFEPKAVAGAFTDDGVMATRAGKCSYYLLPWWLLLLKALWPTANNKPAPSRGNAYRGRSGARGGHQRNQKATIDELPDDIRKLMHRAEKVATELGVLLRTGVSKSRFFSRFFLSSRHGRPQHQRRQRLRSHGIYQSPRDRHHHEGRLSTPTW